MKKETISKLEKLIIEYEKTKDEINKIEKRKKTLSSGIINLMHQLHQAKFSTEKVDALLTKFNTKKLNTALLKEECNSVYEKYITDKEAERLTTKIRR